MGTKFHSLAEVTLQRAEPSSASKLRKNGFDAKSIQTQCKNRVKQCKDKVVPKMEFLPEFFLHFVVPSSVQCS